MPLLSLDYWALCRFVKLFLRLCKLVHSVSFVKRCNSLIYRELSDGLFNC